MFIAKAYAQENDTQPVANPVNALQPSSQELVEPVPPTQEFSALVLPLLLIFCIFYFLLIRPQHKKMKAHEQMVRGLKRGDKVNTSGGIIGTITKIDATSKTLEVEIATGVVVTVLKHMVSELVDDSPIGKEAANAQKNKKK